MNLKILKEIVKIVLLKKKSSKVPSSVYLFHLTGTKPKLQSNTSNKNLNNILSTFLHFTCSRVTKVMYFNVMFTVNSKVNKSDYAYAYKNVY